MEKFVNSFQTFFDGITEQAPEITVAVLLLIVAHFTGKAVRNIYRRILRRGDVSKTHLAFFGKLLYGFILILGILIALNILGFYGLVTSILASGGITAVILGFAFKDIGENFLAGFFMAFSRPFRTGDLIQSEGLVGRVQNIELRHTHIRTADGCDVFIPSAQLLSRPLYNFTRDGLRRGSFEIGIDYRDNAERACELLTKRLSAEERVLSEPAPTVQIQGFNPLYVELSVTFWIEVDTSMQETYLVFIRSQLMEACRTTLVKHGFTFSSEVTSAVEMRDLNVNVRKDNDQNQ
ncbi:MAG: mechanosensitive ion channel family protein [Balneolaceae bacterium]|nr:mechanosensitive ion channel family protein [Balneolaceae bacterium]